MEAPKIPSFFKTKGPRQFKYRPWYYNADKEARDQRNRILKAGLKKSEDSEKTEDESGLHKKWRKSQLGARQRSKSNIRLVIIICLLLWLAYYLLS